MKSDREKSSVFSRFSINHLFFYKQDAQGLGSAVR